MKIYTFDNRAHDWNENITFIHTVMFHGEALLPFPGSGIPSNTLDNETRHALHLYVNAYSLPDVFIPERSTTFVVSERVKNKLTHGKQNYEFLEVYFEKIINSPWSVENETLTNDNYKRHITKGKEYTIFQKCPHEEHLRTELPPYFEIITHRHFLLTKRYKTTYKLNWTKYSMSEDRLLAVSAEMFEEHPMITATFPIIRYDLFAKIQEHIDTRFFGIKEFCIS